MNILKVGHRGTMGYCPENTLMSFQKALDLKMDMTELDVYICKSGELVVIHDDKVDRTTDGHGYIWNKTFTELRKLDAGQGEKIPLLSEVLDLVEHRVKVNIELKGFGTALAVSKLIEDYVQNKGWKYDDFLVSSFIHHELQHFHSLIPQIWIGALIGSIPIGYAKFAEELGAQSIHMFLEFINQKFIDDAHQRGLKVFVWTVNDLDDIERMKNMGVDGFFSNFPDRL